ncbi:MAG: Arabinose import ATP-binding protein AraG [Pseudomonas fluorescens]|nr:MAG: Arabinose import ATP-binding protein AraG [Pseudomonas fluorescens]
MNGAALRFNGIGKEFPGVKALAQISFEARPRSVHALMGENGAGKSTLLKILGGFYQPNSGSLHLGERSVSFKSAADSIASGIAVIHQELQLVPEMTVAENLLLGHMPSRWGVVNRRAMLRKARKLLKGLADEIDPAARLGSLSLGQRQLVEIAKAMSRNAHVIAFDEPTSSLSAREIERLMVIIARLRDEGRVILYVSHRMEEVFRICDAVTVFKDGRFVRTFDDMAQLSVDRLVSCMVGRDIEDIYNYRPRELLGEALRVEGLLGPGLQEPVSLQVQKGEILGLFGLVGAGRTELLRLLAGLARNTQGALVCCTGRRRRSARPGMRLPLACCCVPRTARKRASCLVPAWRRTSTSARAANMRGSAGCCRAAGNAATRSVRSAR